MAKLILGKTPVEVVWEDAWSDSDYHTLVSIEREEPYITYSYGVVIRNNKEGITISREVLPGNRFRAHQHIPRAMIQKVRALR